MRKKYMAEQKLPLNEFERKTGAPVCSRLSRDATSLTAEELFLALLHLVTFEEGWIIDDETGQLRSNIGYWQAIKNLGSTVDRSLHIYGFTNRDANANQGKIYSNLYPLSQDLQDFYNQWRTSQLAISNNPEERNYLKTFQRDFLKNLAAAYDISEWKLVGMERVVPEPWQPTRSDTGGLGGLGARYELTFQGPGGHDLKLYFHPTDRIYFCTYETTPNIARKTDIGNEDSGEAEYMKTYPPTHLENYPCSTVIGKKVPETVGRVIRFIADDAKSPSGNWAKNSGRKESWSVKKLENAIHVNYIYGYKRGIPDKEKQLVYDNGGLRLIRVDRISKDVWKLEFALTNREAWYSLSTPTIDVFSTESSKLQICL